MALYSDQTDERLKVMEFLRRIRDCRAGKKVRGGGAAMAVAALAGVLLAPTVSMAQQPPAQPAQPQAQQPQAQKKAAPENSWVKLCQEQPAVKDGVAIKAKVCLTHHERLSAINGMVLVSIAIRNIENQPQETVMVLVPLGVALPPGMQLIIDDNKPIPLKFTFCHVGGCTAEALATKEVVDQFKKGKEVRVLALNNVGKTVGFPVPLTGFTKAYEGQPVDTAKYQKARQQLMQLIQKRQLELAKKAAAAKKEKESGKKAAPAAPAKAQ